MRSFIVGIKYGLFSDEHMDLIREVKLSNELNTYDLLISILTNYDVKYLISNIKNIMEELKIDENRFVF